MKCYVTPRRTDTKHDWSEVSYTPDWRIGKYYMELVGMGLAIVERTCKSIHTLSLCKIHKASIAKCRMMLPFASTCAHIGGGLISGMAKK
eukprot:6079665-Karenia_brevis.AAC.1